MVFNDDVQLKLDNLFPVFLIQFKLLSVRREFNPHGQYGLLKSNKKKLTPDTRVKTLKKNKI
jgi:hypothetical protein